MQYVVCFQSHHNLLLSRNHDSNHKNLTCITHSNHLKITETHQHKATSPPVMSLNLELTNDDGDMMSPKSSIDDLLEYASSPSHAKHFQNRKIPSSFNSDRGFGLDDDDDDEEDRFGKGMGSFSREEEKKKRKSGFRQRLGDLDDSTDLLDYLLDDSNFSPEQRHSKKKMMEKE